jgi:plasmid stabilization system protein ParE
MFALVWTEHALDDLADIWIAVDPPTRDRIEAAILRLNAELREHPNEVGESRGANRRIAFAGPLVVFFHVDDAAGLVRIHHAWVSLRPR